MMQFFDIHVVIFANLRLRNRRALDDLAEATRACCDFLVAVDSRG